MRPVKTERPNDKPRRRYAGIKFVVSAVSFVGTIVGLAAFFTGAHSFSELRLLARGHTGDIKRTGVEAAMRPAQLSVATTPPGAEVRLNERLVGKSPLAMTESEAGSYMVEVRLAGFITEYVPVRISGGSIVSVTVELFEASADGIAKRQKKIQEALSDFWGKVAGIFFSALGVAMTVVVFASVASRDNTEESLGCGGCLLILMVPTFMAMVALMAGGITAGLISDGWHPVVVVPAVMLVGCAALWFIRKTMPPFTE